MPTRDFAPEPSQMRLYKKQLIAPWAQSLVPETCLFKVVNKNVALLEAIFGLVSTAIEGVSLLAHYAPLVLLRGGAP
jgi:hypothetical protein